jgi:Cu/Ag efflux protein CusF
VRGADGRTRICFPYAVTAPTAVTVEGATMTATKTMLLAAMVWAATASAQAQPPVAKANVVMISATITAVDPATRMLTLRDDAGNEDTFNVSQDVQRFNELKVGQKVNLTYYESVVYQLVKAGEKGSGTSSDAAVSRGAGAQPAATIATQEKMTVTVKSIDPTVPSVTVATDDGRVVTRKIENKKNLENLKPGDKIDITFTRALVTSVSPAN